MAALSVLLDLTIGMAPAMGGMMGGSEWGPFVAQMSSNELDGMAGIIREEILRIRAQPGSGWDEEEAKSLVHEYLGQMAAMMALGT